MNKLQFIYMQLDGLWKKNNNIMPFFQTYVHSKYRVAG